MFEFDDAMMMCMVIKCNNTHTEQCVLHWMYNTLKAHRQSIQNTKCSVRVELREKKQFTSRLACFLSYHHLADAVLSDKSS